MQLKRLVIFLAFLLLVALFVVLEDSHARAAGALVQTKSGNGSNYVNTYALSYPSNVTAGDLLVMSITAGSADTINSISDNVNGAWSLATSSVGADRTTWIYYVGNAQAAATTVTITFGAGQFADSATTLREYSGVVTASPLDRTATANDGTNFVQSHPTGTTGATQQPGELVVAAAGVSNNDIWTAGSGYADLAQQNGFDLFTSNAMADQFVSSTGTYGTTLSTSNFDRGEGAVSTFYLATASHAKVTSLAGKLTSLAGSIVIN